MAFGGEGGERINWLAVLFSFIIGMSIAILTQFKIPWYYFIIAIILVIIIVITVAWTRQWSPIGRLARNMIIHICALIGAILYSYYLYSLQLLNGAVG